MRHITLGTSSTEEATFAVRTVAWLLMGFATGAHAQPVADPHDITRTSSFTYFTSGAHRGLLRTETVEPDRPEQCVTSTHGYDSYGNRVGTTTANCPGASGGALFAARTAGSAFAAQTVTVGSVSVQVPAGTLPTQATNAAGHTETRRHDPRFGAVTSLTGPNGLSTTHTLDDFGRVVREDRADGTFTTIEHCLLAGRTSDVSSNSAGCGSTSALSGRSDEIPELAFSYVQSAPRDTAGNPMGPPARVYKDRAGRVVRELSAVALNASPQPTNRRWQVKDTAYSTTGVAVLRTQPYFLESGSATLTGSHDHGLEIVRIDALGRPVRIDVADPQGQIAASAQHGRTRVWARTTIVYSALTVTTTDAGGRARREEKNIDGQVARVTDASGAQLAHQYDATGQLLQTKDALQNLVTMRYDTRGRQLSLSDPDTGHWEYAHNALGERVWQRSPNQRAAGTQTTMAYDMLGRLTRRVEPEYTSTWHYDRDAAGAACGKSVGQLCESVTSHGLTRKHHYDGLGRPDGSRTLVSGGPGFETWLSYSPTTGRVSRQTYPTRLAVDYVYTSYGALRQVRLANAATLNPLPASPGDTPGASQTWSAGKLLWSAGTVTAWGTPATAELGNGVQARTEREPATGRVLALHAGPGTERSVMDHAYTWDALGRLSSRTDHLGNGPDNGPDNGPEGLTGAVSELYGYDAVNRLNAYTVSAPAIPGLQRTVTLRYNAIGNLLFKSDVGSYSYPAHGNSGGVTRPRPHAVSQVVGQVVGTTSGTVSYGYDANGNAVSASGGKWRSIAYTSFDLPDSQNGVAGPGGQPRSTWQYDERHQRIRETRVDAAGTRTTWILHPDNQGGLSFESETAPDGARSQRHYVSVGAQTLVLVSTAALPALGAPTASQTTSPPAPSALTLVKAEYWLKDHLGSVAVTLDHTGAVTARHAYDPFGKRRHIDGRYDAFGALVIDWAPALNHGTDRGFTGHEHLDDLGLVHMNGRLYDPHIARFLQADPFVQAPGELQALNRYSYCLNNPLNCTDPTGYFSLKKLLKVAAVIVVGIYMPQMIGNVLTSFAAASGSTAFASVMVFDVGVSVTLTGLGNLTCAAVAGFVSGAVATGSLSGAIQGAFSAGLFSGVGEIVGSAGLGAAGSVDDVGAFTEAIALHGVAGCVGSVAGGGKCGPGALSAAFSKAALPITAGLQDGFERATAHAVISGTASELGGGKFANGAVTGAFSYLFNQVVHAPALPGWGAGAGAAGEGLFGGFLSRLFGPLSLALAPSTLGDSSIFPLYRVVSPEELADILARGGQFAFAPGQMEVKQFALTLSDAQYYRDQVIGKLPEVVVDQLSIVQTTVTGPTFRQLQKMILDFRPAAVVTPATLPAVNNDAKKFGVHKVGAE